MKNKLGSAVAGAARTASQIFAYGLNTVVFMDIRDAFDSEGKSSLLNCIQRNGLPEKYICILKTLDQQTSGGQKV